MAQPSPLNVATPQSASELSALQELIRRESQFLVPPSNNFAGASSASRR